MNRKPNLIQRTIAIFLLLVILQPIAAPYYTMALTHGPHQPEYTAYDEPGATDMVNLVTGDFAFNLPVLDVPGPEGGFSVPLTYNAGIGVEQQASWVGLGWNMNVGAIVRSVNEYPDDAQGEYKSITVQDLDAIKGWNSNLGIVQLGWNNQTGHYGSVSLLSIIDYSWNDSGHNSLGIVGVSMSKDGVGFDPVKFTMAVITIATLGAGGVAQLPANIATSLARDAVVGLAMAAIVGSSAPNPSTAGYWKPTTDTDKRLFHTNYWTWLDHTRSENMYGLLYLGKTPDANYVAEPSAFSVAVQNGNEQPANAKMFVSSTNSTNVGSASDINYTKQADNLQYHEIQPDVFLAEDHYSVKAPRISGVIAPYRLDVGSVAMPREMTDNHLRFKPVSFLDYKVPFVYQGAQANAYFHQLGDDNAVTDPNFYYGISHQTDDNLNKLTYLLNDVSLKDQRIKPEVNNTKRLAQGNFVEWMSNKEIKDGVTYPSGYVDFLPAGADRISFRGNFPEQQQWGLISSHTNTGSFNNLQIPVEPGVTPSIVAQQTVNIDVAIFLGFGWKYKSYPNAIVDSKNGNTISVTNLDFSEVAGEIAMITINVPVRFKSENAIGGYSVTAANGTTYHFALPVYEGDNYTEIRKVSHPDTKKSIIKRPSAFAHTWLLTAITGADFVDRDNNGMANDADWGYWVKFNYGKTSVNYQWRMPYDDNPNDNYIHNYVRDVTDQYESYSSGKKELYYLNSIETRSHVALFLKSQRNDGKSVNGVYPLKLDEIALISKETYTALVVNHGIQDFSANTSAMNKVCYTADFSNAAQAYMNQNLLKKIKFTYDYSLCPYTPNSLNNTGKLTLKRLSILGRSADANNTNKIVPDYIFEYANSNPNYNQYKWDAWGFYKGGGTLLGTSHATDQSSASLNSGKEWSLSSILTPQGSKITVNYERDRYTSVSGNEAGYSRSFVANDFVNNRIELYNDPNFQEGEPIKVLFEYTKICNGLWCTPQDPCKQTVLVSGTILGGDAAPTPPDPPLYDCYDGSGSQPMVLSGGKVSKIEKTGGNLRVASVIMENEWGTQIKTRYLYENGTVAQEPPHAMGTAYPFYNYPDYPQTPVMYGKVTILNGNLATDADYHVRHEYEFVTPHTSQYVLNHQLLSNDYLGIKQFFQSFSIRSEQEVSDKTSRIGTLKSVKVYDKNSMFFTPISTTTLEYSEDIPNHQGIYASSALLFERVRNGTQYLFRANRTSVLKYPYVLTRTTTSKDGFVSESINEAWDFNTGMVTQKLQKSPMGINIRTITEPAYTIASYQAMGSKAVDLASKNMLSQQAATYIYKTDAQGVNTGLVSASAQTWKSIWPYRMYYEGTYDFIAQIGVWRRAAAYTWKGNYSRLNKDGTHIFDPLVDKFNFENPQTGTWQYMGEPTLFNTSSVVLESMNHTTEIFSSLKMGYDNRQPLAQATNARYTEMAFSSAEDLMASEPFFGGEVGKGDGTVLYKSKGQTNMVHTGDAVLSLTNGKGFVYKAQNLTPNKRYRASVWTNSPNGRLYFQPDGGIEVLSAAPSETMKVGNWYLLHFNILTSNTPISFYEIGVKSAGGTVLFDDFRFQPSEAAMTAYVQMPLDHEYDGVSSRFEYVLDNDNLYTKYEYNTKGELIKTYRESLQYGEKLVSEVRTNYRRSHVEQ